MTRKKSSQDLSIPISLLRESAELLLDHLQKEFESGVVPLPHDFYWVLDKDEWLNPYRRPEDFSLGQLSFDLEELKGLVQGRIPPLSYDLVRLGALFTAIGREQVR